MKGTRRDNAHEMHHCSADIQLQKWINVRQIFRLLEVQARLGCARLFFVQRREELWILDQTIFVFLRGYSQRVTGSGRGKYSWQWTCLEKIQTTIQTMAGVTADGTGLMLLAQCYVTFSFSITHQE